MAKLTNKKHASFHKQIRLLSVYLRTYSFLTFGLQQWLSCVQKEIFLNENQHHPPENFHVGNPQNSDSPTQHVKQVPLVKNPPFSSS
jgi:hypothetical protein